MLATQVWLHTYATDGVSTEIADYVLAELTPARFTAALRDASIRVRIADHNNNLAGFSLVKFNATCPQARSAVAELQTLYVQAHFIGTGLGKRLLQDAETVARKHANTALWLTVNAQNRRAIDFYDHLGYRKVGTTYFVLGTQRHENHVLVGQGA
ncbi:GNAT family N-acetyltransferase [Rhodoferax sp.]|uniref:GNAT family N-acetyltransferase n=1 Tax=Rhodoferax sp. TaxID=50421 RepID=UPI00277661D9|nr:GNAT family N-acetyltransferase [Rhodoferax sp.]